MHIPDGFLSPVVTGVTDVAGVATWIGSVRRLPLDIEQIPRWGLAGALMFAVEVFSFPVPGGTSVHLSGVPLVTLTLGPIPALFLSGIVLLLQAVLFGHGGILTWGANFINIGIIGVTLTWMLHSIAKRVLPIAVSAGIATGAAILCGALAVSIELSISGVLPMIPTLSVMGIATLPMSLIEGIITGVFYRFYQRRTQL